MNCKYFIYELSRRPHRSLRKVSRAVNFVGPLVARDSSADRLPKISLIIIDFFKLTHS